MQLNSGTDDREAMVMEGGIIDIDTKNLFNQALQLHSAGSLNSAEKIYKEILEKQVDHAEANHNLGLIFVEKNQLSKALNFFKYALDSSPSVSLFWGSYIEVLVGLKRVDEATKLINHLKSANITSEKIEKISEKFAPAAALSMIGLIIYDYCKHAN